MQNDRNQLLLPERPPPHIHCLCQGDGHGSGVMKVPRRMGGRPGRQAGAWCKPQKL